MAPSQSGDGEANVQEANNETVVEQQGFFEACEFDEFFCNAPDDEELFGPSMDQEDWTIAEAIALHGTYEM